MRVACAMISHNCTHHPPPPHTYTQHTTLSPPIRPVSRQSTRMLSLAVGLLTWVRYSPSYPRTPPLAPPPRSPNNCQVHSRGTARNIAGKFCVFRKLEERFLSLVVIQRVPDDGAPCIRGTAAAGKRARCLRVDHVTKTTQGCCCKHRLGERTVPTLGTMHPNAERLQYIDHGMFIGAPTSIPRQDDGKDLHEDLSAVLLHSLAEQEAAISTVAPRIPPSMNLCGGNMCQGGEGGVCVRGEGSCSAST